jgi:peptide/nickel transport system ATP-binding protein
MKDQEARDAPAADARQRVLEVEDLTVHYHTPRGAVIAANGVSFYIRKGEIVGLVGESGCGKTTVAMAILQMVQSPGTIEGGDVRVNGRSILGLPEAVLRKVRWRELALVPQGAMNSLNPVLRIREQIADCILSHERVGNAELHERILRLLDDVGLPARVFRMYPHELSGGMKQRVCIAMAIALNPPVIIADEPTSALDVVVQRVVAQTLMEVKQRLNVSMLLIGHDMGLQAQMVDRVAVMYAGTMVEVAPVKAVFRSPLHPYTRLLIDSIPSIDARKPLKVTEGLTHDLRKPPPGCVFGNRCQAKDGRCTQEKPLLTEVARDHFVACPRFVPESVRGAWREESRP